MGFFQDLKEDLSQAVNELMPDDSLENLEEETKPEEVVEEPVNDPMAKELEAMLAELEKTEAITEPEAVAEPTEEKDVTAEFKAAVEAFEAAEENSASVTAVVTEEPLSAYEENTAESVLADITVEENSEGEETMDTQFMNHDRMALDETATITGGMKIRGDIQSEGSMDVIGCIEGNIDILGKLNVTGTIQGTSKAAEVYAEGANITGDVISDGTIKIGQSSVIIGNLTATSAVIAGAVKGDIDVKGPVILDASAIVMGNIKSKSVQINNGAVIEGLCSQCYADVNPTSFFDDLKKAAKK